jgi:RNA polymerase-interacting CarD/CdnL/TRCF family regulator
VTGVNLTRSIGEYVVYKKRGVFVIESTKEERIGKEVKVYYVLRSVYDEKSTVYVPAGFVK